MGAITEKYFLLKDYKDYTDVFSEKKIAKFPEFEDMEYFINLILEKNLFYRLIYNLFTQKLKVL